MTGHGRSSGGKGGRAQGGHVGVMLLCTGSPMHRQHARCDVTAGHTYASALPSVNSPHSHTAPLCPQCALMTLAPLYMKASWCSACPNAPPTPPAAPARSAWRAFARGARCAGSGATAATAAPRAWCARVTLTAAVKDPVKRPMTLLGQLCATPVTPLSLAKPATWTQGPAQRIRSATSAGACPIARANGGVAPLLRSPMHLMCSRFAAGTAAAPALLCHTTRFGDLWMLIPSTLLIICVGDHKHMHAGRRRGISSPARAQRGPRACVRTHRARRCR